MKSTTQRISDSVLRHPPPGKPPLLRFWAAAAAHAIVAAPVHRPPEPSRLLHYPPAPRQAIMHRRRSPPHAQGNILHGLLWHASGDGF